MRGRIVTATLDHATAMASRLRLFDTEGPYGVLARDPAGGLKSSIERATHAWAGLIDEEPVCLFGLNAPTIVSNRATAWLFTTTDIERHRSIFWRGSRDVVAAMRALYPTVEGYCDARFEASARWLERLGFHLSEPKVIAGIPFHHFEMS